MFALERQKKILELIDLSGSVSVNMLGDELGVTVETIRRDLEKLENAKKLTRTHGGAIAFSEKELDLPAEKRTGLNIIGKTNVAKMAAKHIESGDAIFLDGSTTSFYLSKLLKDFRNITIITNSMQILDELSYCDGIKLISTGGVYDKKNKSLVGEFAVESITNSFCASKVFFSGKGISKEKGILESNDVEYQIKKAMLENSSQKIFLADKSKFDGSGFLKLCSLSDIDILITDAELDDAWRKILSKNKVILG